MSMMKTLAKVAIGVAVAKGAKAMMSGASTSQSGGLGGLLGGAQTQASSGGGLGDMMGQILGGGGASAQSGGMGGLGGLLEQLGGGSLNTQLQQGNMQTRGGGGLEDMLGSLLGGGAAQPAQQSGGLGGLLGGAAAGGGLGGLLGGLLSAAGGAKAQPQGGAFGDTLNQAMLGNEPAAPTVQQEALAALMLRAMIQAAKSDGKLDEHERAKLLDQLGDVSPEEQAFVQAELAKPVDVDALIDQIPRGMEQQVYTMSVMAIDLDSQAEAQYLHSLASGLGIDPAHVNAIHGQLGVQKIYG